MDSLYLIHSAKGTSWSNHKYIKKVGNKYIYAEDKISTSDLNSAVRTTMSGKNGTGSDMKKKLGNNYGIVAKTISSKFKKPSGKSGSSKSSSKSGSKATSEKESSSKSSSSKSSSSKEKTSSTSKSSTSTTTTTAPSASTIPTLKTAITSVAKIGENDSYIVTQKDDGTSTVSITYEDGTTQTIELDKQYKVVSVGEKIKPEEKEEDEVKHCHSDRFDSTYYGINYVRRF